MSRDYIIIRNPQRFWPTHPTTATILSIYVVRSKQQCFKRLGNVGNSHFRRVYELKKIRPPFSVARPAFYSLPGKLLPAIPNLTLVGLRLHSINNLVTQRSDWRQYFNAHEEKPRNKLARSGAISYFVFFLQRWESPGPRYCCTSSWCRERGVYILCFLLVHDVTLHYTIVQYLNRKVSLVDIPWGLMGFCR